MLDAIITSQTRIKLLISLFLNTNTEKYLRQFAEELNESPSIIKTELDRFEKAGLIVSEQKGNKKFYKVNKTYPLYNEITSIVQKTLGLDKIYEMVESLGNIEQAFIVGDYANGIDSGIIDPLLVTKSALINAASVATTILSTDCIINNIRLHEGDRK